MLYDVTIKRYRGIDIEAESEAEAVTKAKEFCQSGEMVACAEEIKNGGEENG